MSAEAPDGAAPPIRVSDVRASRGVRWLAGGFALFKERPLGWLGLALGWLVMSFGLLIIPLIGVLAFYLLQPVFFASFALVARKQGTGERIDSGDLFLGFKSNLKALAGVGAIELFVAVCVSVVFATFAVPTAIDGTGRVLGAQELVAQLQGKEWILIGGFLLVGIVKGALWFTPALIAFHGLSAAHAVRWSLYAALSNVGAMVLYSIALFAMFFAAALPWLLGLFIAMPVMIASTYVGYREVFEEESKVKSD
ncbi:hypothetical protein BWI17_04475 [Betaproteobacteria bacterium GR16-43]|nr:hypothetical protein BWI17_04475 [Betaproteobacteria bacterium GR16-43]